MTAGEVLTVSEITVQLKKLIRGNFRRVKVVGELADFTKYEASGHMYFSLTDGEARLGGVMFAYANRRLEFEPREGMEVVVEGRMDVYEPRGNYQVVVEEMSKAGEGGLEREFQKLKEQLEKEGALSPARKRALPEFPVIIGVVTSGDGAAFWDIVNTLKRRCPAVHVVLYPCRVNGREAAPEVAAAIKRLPGVVDIDCMIVGRGGGSPEDLWAFNEEEVARAIIDCPVPVISAVGHEVDVTISDLVADHRSPTPTAAGEEVAPSLEELKRELGEFKKRMKTSYRNRVDRGWERLQFMGEKRVFADPLGWVKPFREKLELWRERFHNNYRRNLRDKRHEWDQQRGKLESLNPERVLKRGYTVVERGEELVTEARAVEAGEELRIRWWDGEVGVVVGED